MYIVPPWFKTVAFVISVLVVASFFTFTQLVCKGTSIVYDYPTAARSHTKSQTVCYWSIRLR